MTCLAEGCAAGAIARGRCNMHYGRAKRAGEFDVRLLSFETDRSWMVNAACRGMSPALFFPENGEQPKEARRVCAVCPVQAECLRYAAETRVVDGVWGGLAGRALRNARKTVTV